MALQEIEQSLELDLVNIQHNIITARQGDNLTRTLSVTITNNGYTYNISSDSYVYLKGKRADDRVIFYPGKIIDSTNGVVKFDIHDYVLSVAGRAKLQVVLYSSMPSSENDNSVMIASTNNFVLYIPEDSIDESEIVDSDEGSVLAQLINSANEVIEDLQKKIDNFVLNEDKDVAGGVPSLDSNTKVPIAELYEATTTRKGITQLTDSISSTSTTTAATPNSVKKTYDSIVESDSTIITNTDIDEMFE